MKTIESRNKQRLAECTRENIPRSTITTHILILTEKNDGMWNRKVMAWTKTEIKKRACMQPTGIISEENRSNVQVFSCSPCDFFLFVFVNGPR